MDQFLVSWLIGSIYVAMLGPVIRCTSAAKIWSTLDEVFRIQSKARILQLRQQLQLKQGATPVNEYVLKKRTLSDCLIDASQQYLIMRLFFTFYLVLVQNMSVDQHFSHAPPLDRRDSLFICENLIFGKKLEPPLILFLF